MRGVPNHPVQCMSCGRQQGCAKDSLCHRCRINLRPNPRKRFWWTPDLDQQLVRIYQNTRRRQDLSKGLTHLQRLTGFSRVTITSHASELGLCHVQRRPWTATELDFVAENAGTLSISAIARRLRRTHYSVKAKASGLRRSMRVRQGYSREDVRLLLGVRSTQVRRWIGNGWLRVEEERVTEKSIKSFLANHPEEYRLSRVDEAWYKSLLFPTFGRGHAFKNTNDMSSRQPSAGVLGILVDF
jgi:hypothetical protein